MSLLSVELADFAAGKDLVPTTVEICARFFSRLLPSQMPWITFSPTLAASPGTWSRPFSIE